MMPRQLQHTLVDKVEFKGVGLHSGVPTTLTINPAAENTGIVFQRVDLPSKPIIPALYSAVVDTRNCTCLGDENKNIVSTIEHIMSALYIVGIDNAIVEVDNQEIPIMDGSAKAFYDVLKKAEIRKQEAYRKFLVVKREVSFTDDRGNIVALEPHKGGLKIDFFISFPSRVVGDQRFNDEITSQIFEKEIAFCRTFCEKTQIDYLQSIGLIKGGSLDNAVVLDGDTILNPGGLKCEHECVNHKVLDAIGDLYTSGYHIIGELKAERTGHYHSNELLKKLFADKSNYELV